MSAPLEHSLAVDRTPSAGQVSPAGQAAPRPPVPKRWKLWLLTCFAIYPVITGLGYLVQEVAGGLPVWAHFLILVPIAVGLLVFLVMPTLTRRFARWLTR